MDMIKMELTASATQKAGVATRGRLLVIDKHSIVAIGLRCALSSREWDVEVSTGPSDADVIDAADSFRPDCVLLDVRLGSIGSGIDLIAPLASTGAQVVMLTAERRRAVLAECLEAGASGWVSKSVDLDELDDVVQRAVAGEAVIGRTQRAELLAFLRDTRAEEQRVLSLFDQLTPRESLVLAALSDGLLAEEIAREQYVSVATVRSQIRSILQKLGVRSQVAAIAIAGANRELLPARPDSKRDRRRNYPQDRGCGPEFSVSIA